MGELNLLTNGRQSSYADSSDVYPSHQQRTLSLDEQSIAGKDIVIK
jgi:hypothetical protein